jgi:hypothetical protein
VDAPRRRAEARVIVVRTDGRRTRQAVRLDRRGDGSLTVRFDARGVARVIVTLVNTSTRYRCHEGTLFACGGQPRDDDARFGVAATVIHRQSP